MIEDTTMATITLPKVDERTSHSVDLDANGNAVDFYITINVKATPRSYFAFINKDPNVKQIAFGAAPTADDFFNVNELGFYQGDHALFGRGDVHIWVKGLGTFIVVY